MSGRGWSSGRCRWSGGNLLAAFLAATAELPGFMRALDANQCAARRPRVGRFHRMLDNRRFGPPDLRRWRFASFRRLGLALDYSYRAPHRVRSPATIQAFGCQVGTVARLPDDRAVQLGPGTLAGSMRPPIGWTRLVVTPDDEVMIVPIKVVVEPRPYREAHAE